MSDSCDKCKNKFKGYCFTIEHPKIDTNGIYFSVCTACKDAYKNKRVELFNKFFENEKGEE